MIECKLVSEIGDLTIMGFLGGVFDYTTEGGVLKEYVRPTQI